MRRMLGLMVAMLCTATCEGALFLTAPVVFFSGPTSQLGTVTGNTLVLTSTPNGFIVSGQVIITVPAAPSSGILVEWIVDRPLDPLYAGPFSLNTTTVLDGFSLPPIGGFQNTAGNVSSEFTNVGTASYSSISMTLVNGVDNPPWINLSNTSSTFTYAPSAGTLRQHFVLDGVYAGGPGGTWTIDVPVTTFVSASVPEPSGMVLGLAGACLMGLVFRIRSRRK